MKSGFETGYRWGQKWCAGNINCGCRNAGDCVEPTKVCRSMSDMLYKLACPFKDSCGATIGCSDNDTGRKIVHEWMAKHLAKYHAEGWSRIILERQTELAIMRQEMHEELTREMGLHRKALSPGPSPPESD